MSDGLLDALVLASALGCGLMAGVFFAFSAFVMKALARLPAPAGVTAMQSINVAVLNPLFLGAFLGTAAACLVAGVLGALSWREPGGLEMLAGSVLYLVGTFLVTVAVHVPRNNRLAVADTARAETARLWARYVPFWTRWNHVRAAAALLAAAAFILAMRSRVS